MILFTTLYLLEEFFHCMVILLFYFLNNPVLQSPQLLLISDRFSSGCKFYCWYTWVTCCALWFVLNVMYTCLCRWSRRGSWSRAFSVEEIEPVAAKSMSHNKHSTSVLFYLFNYYYYSLLPSPRSSSGVSVLGYVSSCYEVSHFLLLLDLRFSFKVSYSIKLFLWWLRVLVNCCVGWTKLIDAVPG